MALPLPNPPAPQGDACDDRDTVLLAIDEPSIGRMLCGVFKRSGINVLWNGGLAPALALLKENPSSVGTIFVDCAGTLVERDAFCRIALSVRPGIRIVIAGSDEARSGIVSPGLGSAVFIPKPYLPTELAWQLRATCVVRAA
jgi:DNA-binding response OmpR family regulator